MFKIESIIYQPFPEEFPEVKIKLLAPSYAQRLKAMMAAPDASAGGPAANSVGETWPFIKSLVESCVQSCEGIEVDGQELKTGFDLIEKGPQEIINPLSEKLMELLKVPEVLKKKS